MSKSTITIRAPKHIVYDMRTKFPSLNDAQIIKVMHDTSLLRLEGFFRTNVKKKK